MTPLGRVMLAIILLAITGRPCAAQYNPWAEGEPQTATQTTQLWYCNGGATSWWPDQDITVSGWLWVDGVLVDSGSAQGYSPAVHLETTVSINNSPHYLYCYIEGAGVAAWDDDWVNAAVPTGESTSPIGWRETFTTAHDWTGTLQGGTFGGRLVREVEAGYEDDNCWFPGSNYNQYTGLSGGEWEVDGSNNYGPDLIGWGYYEITYYRTWNHAPCQWVIDQAMEINNGNLGWIRYKVNRLKAGIGLTTIWSERDGQRAIKPF